MNNHLYHSFNFYDLLYRSVQETGDILRPEISEIFVFIASYRFLLKTHEQEIDFVLNSRPETPYHQGYVRRIHVLVLLAPVHHVRLLPDPYEVNDSC